MTSTHEHSAGVIPYRWKGGRDLAYLVLHSATVRNPRAKWEFPKGGLEPGEVLREAAAREFREETSLSSWAFREGFERSLSYTYVRRGRKVMKTVAYFIVEVFDDLDLAPPRSTSRIRSATGSTGVRSNKSHDCSITPRSVSSSPRPTPGSARRSCRSRIARESVSSCRTGIRRSIEIRAARAGVRNNS
jgi:ADP-ribose pyrophosphatase YjhB (NUDIX family)